MLTTPFGRGAWKRSAVVICVALIGGASYAAKKASVVVAMVEIPGKGSIVIADPQVTALAGRFYGQLSFAIFNQTPQRIMKAGRLVLRQYMDDKRTVQASENATVYFNEIMPGVWGESSTGLLRQKVKAFDVLAVELYFAEDTPQASVLDRPRTSRFAHEFQKGEAKAIIAKSYGRAKVE
jgi:hypothetical protein